MAFSLLLLLAAVAAGAPTAEVSASFAGAATPGGSQVATLTLRNDGDSAGHGAFFELWLPAEAAAVLSVSCASAGSSGDCFNFASSLASELDGSPLAKTASGGALPLSADSDDDRLFWLWLNDTSVAGGGGTLTASVLVTVAAEGDGLPPTTQAATEAPPTETPLELAASFTLRCRGGFLYGADDDASNYAVDPAILSARQPQPQRWTALPLLVAPPLALRVVDEPDGGYKLAAGPSFLLTMTAQLFLPPSVTATDLQLTATLPTDAALQSYARSDGGAAPTVLSAPALSVATAAPNNVLSLSFGDVSGSAWPDADVSVSLTFFVPKLLPGGNDSNTQLDLVGGAPLPFYLPLTASTTLTAAALADGSGCARSVNASCPLRLSDGSAAADGSDDNVDANAWQLPLAAGGAPLPATAARRVRVRKMALLVSKSWSMLDSRAQPQLAAGDDVLFQLAVQVSDFFAAGDLLLTDLLDDGFLPLLSDAPPALSVSAGSGAGSPEAAFLFGSELRNSSERIGNDAAPATPGGMLLYFNLSSALPRAGGRQDGVVVGPGELRVSLRARVADNYTDTFKADGQRAVVAGDVLFNTAIIDGSLRNRSALADTQATQRDLDVVELPLPVGSIDLSAFAVNGVACAAQPCAEPVIASPGDNVTLRITYPLFASDFQALTLALRLGDDAVPLAVSSALPSPLPAPSAAVPPLGAVSIGPNDTAIHALNMAPGGERLLGADAAGDSDSDGDGWLAFPFGSDDRDDNLPRLMDLLVTVRWPTEHFTAETELELLAEARENGVSSNDTLPLVLGVPQPQISKGALAFNSNASPDPMLLPPAVAAVAVAAPGMLGGPSPPWSPPLSPTAAEEQPLSSSITGFDAGDRLRFGLQLVNTGLGTAYNLTVVDQLPPFLTVPPAEAGGLNLTVLNGRGEAVAFEALQGGLFGDGLLVHTLAAAIPPANEEASDEADLNGGRNVILITYDLLAPDDLLYGSDAPDVSASLRSWHNGVGLGSEQPLHSNSMQVTSAVPRLLLEELSSSDGSTTSPALAAGERVTLRARATLPEGQAPFASLQLLLPEQLVVQNAWLQERGDRITSSLDQPVGRNATIQSADEANAGGLQRLSVDLGELSVLPDGSDGPAQAVAMQLSAQLALTDEAPADSGELLPHRTIMQYTVVDLVTLDGGVLVALPVLEFVGGVNASSGDAGDAIRVALTLRHAATSLATAYNVTVTDVFAGDLRQLVTPGDISLTLAGSGADSLPSPQLLAGNSSEDTTLALQQAQLPLGSTLALQYNLRFTQAVPAGGSVQLQVAATYTTGDGPPQPAILSYALDVAAPLAVTPAAVSLAVDNSSVAGSTSPQVAAGERVQVAIVVTLPEGLADVNATLILPAGLSTPSDGGAPTMSLARAGSALQLPQAALPLAASAVDGARVSWQLTGVSNVADGGVTADDGDVLRVAVDVLVAADGSLRAGDTAELAVELAQPDGKSPLTAALQLTVIEPVLALTLTANVSHSDLGAPVLYTAQLQHAGSSLLDADDVVLRDDTLALRPVVAGSVAVTGSSAAGDLFAFSNGDATLATAATALPLADDLTLVYVARLAGRVGQPQLARVNASWTNGAGQLLAAAAELSITTPPPRTVELAISNSSLAASGAAAGSNPAIDDVVVGESFTLLLNLTTEEAVQAVTFVVTLPDGDFLQLLGSELLSVGASITGVQPAVGSAATVSDGGKTLTFELGPDVTNTPDGAVNADDRILLAVQLRVRDDDFAPPPGSLLEVAVAQHFGGAAPLTTSLQAEVVAPLLLAAATVNATADVDGGDALLYTVTLSHADSSLLPAADVALVDTIDAASNRLLLPDSVSITSSPAALADGATVTTADDVLRVQLAELPAGGTMTLSYVVTLRQSVRPGSTLAPQLEVSWDSLPGSGGGAAFLLVSPPATAVASPSSPWLELLSVPDRGDAPSAHRADATDVAAGQVFVVRGSAPLVEGTTPLLLNVVVPPGLALLATRVATLPARVSGDLLVAGAPASQLLDLLGADGRVDTAIFPLGDVQLAIADGGIDAGEPAVQRAVSVELLLGVYEADSSVDGAQLDVQVSMDFGLGGSGGSLPMDAVAPLLIIEQQLNASRADAGDDLLHNITIRHADASSADAFDITLRDDLLPMRQLVAGSVLLPDGATMELQADGSAVTIQLASLPHGSRLQLQYVSRLSDAVQPGQLLPVSPQLSYATASAADAAAAVAAAGFSNALPAPAPRTVVQDGGFTVAVPLPPLVTPEPDSSELGLRRSLLNGSRWELAAGERMTATLTIGYAQGQTNSTLLLTLPEQLQLVDVSLTARGDDLVFVGGALASAGIGDSLDVVSDEASSGAGAGDGDGGDGDSGATVVQLPLGTVTNAGSPGLAAALLGSESAEQSIVLQLTVAASPDAPLPAASSDAASLADAAAAGLQVTLSTTGEAPLEETTELVIELAQPVLNLTASLSADSADAGDQLQYSLTIAHAWNSTSTAFQLRLEDSFVDDALRTLDEASLTVSGGGDGSDASLSVVDGVVVLTASSLALGEQLQLAWTYTLTGAVAAAQEVQTEPLLAWTSLPPSAAAAPGRNYSSTDGRVASVVPPPTAILSRDSGALGNNAPLGGLFDWMLPVRLPEGVTPLTVTFTLPSELTLSEVAADSVGASLSGVSTGQLVDSSGSSPVTVELGTITNTADGSEDDDDVLLLRLQARLPPAATNTPQLQVASPIAQLAYERGSSAASVTAAAQTIVAPALVVAVASTTDFLLPGDNVTHTVTVRHPTASSFGAQRVQLAISLPSGLTVQQSSLTSSHGSASVDADGARSGGALVTVDVGTLPLGETLTLSYSGETAAGSGSVLQDFLQAELLYSSASTAGGLLHAITTVRRGEDGSVYTPLKPPAELLQGDEPAVSTDSMEQLLPVFFGTTTQLEGADATALAALPLPAPSQPGLPLLRYTPNANYAGSDRLLLRLCDAAERECASRTLSVVLFDVVDLPALAETAEEDSIVDFDVKDAVSGTLDVAFLGLSSALLPAEAGEVAVNGSSALRFTPTDHWNGEATVDYIACSDAGSCGVGQLTVTLSAVDDPLMLAGSQPVMRTVAEDVVLSMPLSELVSDVDGDVNSTTFSIQVAPTSGTVELVEEAESDDGSIFVVYTPTLDFFGDDTWTVRICDTASCVSPRVDVTVTPVEDAPRLPAAPWRASMAEDGTLSLDVAALLSDPEGNADVSSLEIVGEASNGMAAMSAAGQLTYSPAQHWHGDEQLVVRVCDTTDTCANGTLIVTVTSADDPPFLAETTVSINGSAQATVSLLPLSTDVDGDVDRSTLAIVGQPAAGSAVLSVDDGTVVYTAGDSFLGNDTLVWQLCDSGGLCSRAALHLRLPAEQAAGLDSAGDASAPLLLAAPEPLAVTAVEGLPTQLSVADVLNGTAVTAAAMRPIVSLSAWQPAAHGAVSTEAPPATGWLQDDALLATYQPAVTFLSGDDEATLRICLLQAGCMLRTLDITVVRRVPAIVSIVANDEDDLDDVWGDGDSITIRFDVPTSQPSLRDKAAVDAVFAWDVAIGSDYDGRWQAADIAVITVRNATGGEALAVNETTVRILRSAGLTNQAGDSAISTSQSPPLSGDFGQPVCPGAPGVHCNARGDCAPRTGVCICDSGWASSSACSVCSDGWWGPFCQPCPAVADGGLPCSGHGSCSGSGTLSGNGRCSCSLGWEGSDCGTARPKRMQVAQALSSLAQVLVDIDPDLPAIYGLPSPSAGGQSQQGDGDDLTFPCDTLFIDAARLLGSGAVCRVEDSHAGGTTVSIELAHGASLKPTQLASEECLPDACLCLAEIFPDFPSCRPVRAPPAGRESVPLEAVILGPLSIGPYDELTLDGRASQGHAGRGLAFRWTLADSTLPRANTTALSVALAAQLLPVLTVPSHLLVAGHNYTLQLEATSEALGERATAQHELRVATTAAPLMQLLTSPQLDVLPDRLTQLAVAALPWHNGSTDASQPSLKPYTLRWLQVGGPPLAELPVVQRPLPSGRSHELLLPAGSLLPGESYDLQLQLLPEGEAADSTAQPLGSVDLQLRAAQPLSGWIVGGDRAVVRDAPLQLAFQLAPLSQSLTVNYTWACVHVDGARAGRACQLPADTARNTSMLSLPTAALPSGNYTFSVAVMLDSAGADDVQPRELTPSVHVELLADGGVNGSNAAALLGRLQPLFFAGGLQYLEDGTVLLTAGRPALLRLSAQGSDVSDADAEQLLSGGGDDEQAALGMQMQTEEGIALGSQLSLLPSLSALHRGIDAEQLYPGRRFTLELAASDAGGASLLLAVAVNPPPSSGHLEVAPTEGLANRTPFLLSALGWTDDAASLPLRYRWGWDARNRSSPLLVAPQTWLEATVVLPAGDSARNWSLALWVEVEDALGARTVSDKLEDGTPAQAAVRPDMTATLDDYLAEAREIARAAQAAAEEDDAQALERTMQSVVALLEQLSQSRPPQPQPYAVDACATQPACSGHGSCASPLPTGAVSGCSCESGFAGVDCALTEDEMAARSELRALAVTALDAVLRVPAAAATDGAADNVARVVRQIADAPDEVTEATAIMLTQLAATALATSAATPPAAVRNTVGAEAALMASQLMQVALTGDGGGGLSPALARRLVSTLSGGVCGSLGALAALRAESSAADTLWSPLLRVLSVKAHASSLLEGWLRFPLQQPVARDELLTAERPLLRGNETDSLLRVSDSHMLSGEDEQPLRLCVLSWRQRAEVWSSGSFGVWPHTLSWQLYNASNAATAINATLPAPENVTAIWQPRAPRSRRVDYFCQAFDWPEQAWSPSTLVDVDDGSDESSDSTVVTCASHVLDQRLHAVRECPRFVRSDLRFQHSEGEAQVEFEPGNADGSYFLRLQGWPEFAAYLEVTIHGVGFTVQPDRVLFAAENASEAVRIVLTGDNEDGVSVETLQRVDHDLLLSDRCNRTWAFTRAAPLGVVLVPPLAGDVGLAGDIGRAVGTIIAALVGVLLCCLLAFCLLRRSMNKYLHPDESEPLTADEEADFDLEDVPEEPEPEPLFSPRTPSPFDRDAPIAPAPKPDSLDIDIDSKSDDDDDDDDEPDRPSNTSVVSGPPSKPRELPGPRITSVASPPREEIMPASPVAPATGPIAPIIPPPAPAPEPEPEPESDPEPEYYDDDDGGESDWSDEDDDDDDEDYDDDGGGDFDEDFFIP